jgi:hypothetical protein
MTPPPVLLQGQPAMILLLERASVSWSLAVDERGGHKDLCGRVVNGCRNLGTNGQRVVRTHFTLTQVGHFC